MDRKPYPTDLTDEQWKRIEPLFSVLRVYKWPKRDLMNAVLYLEKTGCQWRKLPADLPPWETVHSFYRRAKLRGLLDKIYAELGIEAKSKKKSPANSTDANSGAAKNADAGKEETTA